MAPSYKMFFIKRLAFIIVAGIILRLCISFYFNIYAANDNNDRCSLQQLCCETERYALLHNRHSIMETLYIDPYNNRHLYFEKEPTWKEPLGKDLLIVDIDTRIPDVLQSPEKPQPFSWEALNETQPGGYINAAILNHFLYGKAFSMFRKCSTYHNMY